MPEGVGLRFRKDGGLVIVNSSDSYRIDGDTYTSPNYKSADHRIDLVVEMGVGRIVILDE